MLFRRRPVLQRPVNPLRDFWVSADVRLTVPIEVEDDDDARPMVGYIRNFGVRTTPGRLAELMTAEIADGLVVWDQTEYYEIDPDELDSTIRNRVVPVVSEGIWYRSGRAFYPEDEEHDSTGIH